MRTFGWLHLADLHHSGPDHDRRWPTAQDVLLADLQQLHGRCGPWDLVLLSGDLTHGGSKPEFDALDRTLDTLWEHLRRLGSSPCLLAVPGNHDLVRPDECHPAVRVLSRWADDPAACEEFWVDPHSPYRAVIREAFAPFTEWFADHRRCTLRLTVGEVPGDFSGVLEKDGLRLGIVGLNSAFADLSRAAAHERLVLDVRQLNSVCAGDGPAWVKRCDFTLLMTHHPAAWLTPQARGQFDAVVAPPGRFVAHLFGHTHVPAVITSAGGTRPIAGRSLFGRPLTSSGADRPYGYCAGRIAVDAGGEATLRLWPRTVRRHAKGHWQIVQDLDADLQGDHGTRPEVIATGIAPLRSPAAAPVRHLFTPVVPAARILTVICAPPDFGKTELLGALAASHGERSLRIDANPLTTLAQFERSLQRECERKKIALDELDDRWLVLIDDLHALDQIKLVKEYKNRLIERTRVVVATQNPELWRLGVKGSTVTLAHVRRDPAVPLRPPSRSKLRAFVSNLPALTRDRLRAALRGAPQPDLEDLCITDRDGYLALDAAWTEMLRGALESA